MRKRLQVTGFVASAMIAVALLIGLSSGINAQQPPPPTPEVKIDNFSFSPTTLTVAVGTTITWINRDDIPHKVASTDDVFKSKALDTDDKFSYTFSKAGTYPYFCSLHPKMTGKIVVQ